MRMSNLLKNLILKTAPVVIIVLYVCLRSNVQWFEHPDGPHTHYFAIKQKLQKSAPLEILRQDDQTIQAVTASNESASFTTTLHVIVPVAHQNCTGSQLSPPGLHDRAPPIVLA
jgi:hypothetical protein